MHTADRSPKPARALDRGPRHHSSQAFAAGWGLAMAPLMAPASSRMPAHAAGQAAKPAHGAFQGIMPALAHPNLHTHNRCDGSASCPATGTHLERGGVVGGQQGSGGAVVRLLHQIGNV